MFTTERLTFSNLHFVNGKWSELTGDFSDLYSTGFWLYVMFFSASKTSVLSAAFTFVFSYFEVSLSVCVVTLTPYELFPHCKHCHPSQFAPHRYSSLSIMDAVLGSAKILDWQYSSFCVSFNSSVWSGAYTVYCIERHRDWRTRCPSTKLLEALWNL